MDFDQKAFGKLTFCEWFMNGSFFFMELSFIKLKYYLSSLTRKGLDFFDLENNEIHVDAFS